MGNVNVVKKKQILGQSQNWLCASPSPISETDIEILYTIKYIILMLFLQLKFITLCILRYMVLFSFPTCENLIRKDHLLLLRPDGSVWEGCGDVKRPPKRHYGVRRIDCALRNVFRRIWDYMRTKSRTGRKTRSAYIGMMKTNGARENTVKGFLLFFFPFRMKNKIQTNHDCGLKGETRRRVLYIHRIYVSVGTPLMYPPQVYI